MVAVPILGGSHFSPVRLSSCGSVWNPRQLQASNVLLQVLPPSGVGFRRSFHPMGQSVDVCLSPIQPSSLNSTRVCSLQRGDDYRGPILAEPTLVSNHPEAPGRPPIQFPADVKLLSQKKRQLVHADLQSLQLRAWKLSTDASSRKEFLREL